MGGMANITYGYSDNKQLEYTDFPVIQSPTNRNGLYIKATEFHARYNGNIRIRANITVTSPSTFYSTGTVSIGYFTNNPQDFLGKTDKSINEYTYSFGGGVQNFPSGMTTISYSDYSGYKTPSHTSYNTTISVEKGTTYIFVIKCASLVPTEDGDFVQTTTVSDFSISYDVITPDNVVNEFPTKVN